MYSIRPYAGLGRTLAQDADCRSGVFGGFFTPVCWTMLQASPVAPPRAPEGDVLTVPPASGEEAQATVDALVNQQLIDQQALNASKVSSSWWDSAASAVVAAGDAVSPSFPWLLAGLVGLGVFGLVAIGGGSPRRYAR